MFRRDACAIQHLIDYLEGGDSIDVFLEDFPTVFARAGYLFSRRGEDVSWQTLRDCPARRVRPRSSGAVSSRARRYDRARTRLGRHRNGDLLALAEKEFDVFITVDKKLPDEHEPSEFDIAIILIRSASNRLNDLEQPYRHCWKH